MARKLTDTYSRTEVFEFPNGKSIVHYPDLTPEEYERRHKQLEEACIKFMIEVDRTRREKIV